MTWQRVAEASSAVLKSPARGDFLDWLGYVLVGLLGVLLLPWWASGLVVVLLAFWCVLVACGAVVLSR